VGAFIRKIVVIFIGYLFIGFVMVTIIQSGVEASSGKEYFFREAAFLWRVAFLDLLFVCASVAIYMDATKYKIGHVPGAKGLLNMSGAAIATFALVAAPFVIPLYLANRHDLILRAKERPIEKGRDWFYLCFVFAFVLLSPFLFVLGMAGGH
jgi:hypothetical protein